MGVADPGDTPMRGWAYALLPVAIAVYFLVYPDKLSAVLHWMEGLMR